MAWMRLLTMHASCIYMGDYIRTAIYIHMLDIWTYGLVELVASGERNHMELEHQAPEPFGRPAMT
jgi:hypothetical protein